MVNKENRRVYLKHYRETHREQARERMRRWHEAHHEEELASEKRYRKEHREERLAYMERWNAEHPGQRQASNKQWRQAHPELMYRSSRSRRARIAGARIGPRIDFQGIKVRDQMLCGICGKKVAQKDLSFDHILPLSQGGAHSEDNLRITHLVCNVRRQARGSAQLRLALQ